MSKICLNVENICFYGSSRWYASSNSDRGATNICREKARDLLNDVLCSSK